MSPLGWMLVGANGAAFAIWVARRIDERLDARRERRARESRERGEREEARARALDDHERRLAALEGAARLARGVCLKAGCAREALLFGRYCWEHHERRDAVEGSPAPRTCLALGCRKPALLRGIYCSEHNREYLHVRPQGAAGDLVETREEREGGGS